MEDRNIAPDTSTKKEKISLVDNGILSSNDIIKEVKKYIK